MSVPAKSLSSGQWEASSDLESGWWAETVLKGRGAGASQGFMGVGHTVRGQ